MSTIRVYNMTGEEKAAAALDATLSKEKISPKAYSCAVRVLLQNARQGTVGVKGRSDVAFSGKKPWKQKGTGRARVGTKSSPIWRKGGVVFGPQKRVRMLRVLAEQKRGVFASIFAMMLEGGNIMCIDDEGAFAQPSTKAASRALKPFAGKKVVLFARHDDVMVAASFRNIPSVRLVPFDGANAMSLTQGGTWVFLKKDMDAFKEMVLRWN